MRNPVAKNINKFNKPSTHVDRKKESKKSPTLEDFETLKKAFDEANVPPTERYVHVNGKMFYIDKDSYVKEITEENEKTL